MNKINHKCYVGITGRKPEHRWNGGRGYDYNHHFYSSIKKYGWDEGFDHLILYENLTQEEAIMYEKYYIKLLNTLDPEFGYNLTTGGEGTPGFYPSEKTRKLLSECRKKENLSPETLIRRSLGLRGRKFSEDHKRKIGKANSKPINMYSLQGEFIQSFPSAREAEVTLGISHSHISQCCYEHRQTTGGYKWAFSQ